MVGSLALFTLLPSLIALTSPLYLPYTSFTEELKTIDYVDKKKPSSVVFRTCDAEKGKVVFQVGAPEAAVALRAVTGVSRDVAAVDVNMGCPKHFSVSGGMGAALLSKPEVAADIIGTLKRNLNIPVFGKIRLLADEPIKNAVELMKRLEMAGASCIAVHLRTTNDTYDDAAHWDYLPPILSSFTNVPVIANGGVWNKEDIKSIRQQTGCQAVMLARGALRNMSIFTPGDDVLPLEEVMADYLKLSCDYANIELNTKYLLQQFLRYNDLLDSPKGRLTNRGKTIAEFCKIWDVMDYYNSSTISKGVTIGATETKYTDEYFVETKAKEEEHRKGKGKEVPSKGASEGGGGRDHCVGEKRTEREVEAGDATITGGDSAVSLDVQLEGEPVCKKVKTSVDEDS
jgi:tRNA-dihydrouridine synthase 2